MVEAYFDESGTHNPNEPMCIAGYVMRSDQARRLDAEWLAVLQKHNLPYFHMASCAHGTGVFADRSLTERVQIETSMINIIKRRVERGVVASITEEQYLRLVPPLPRVFAGSAYSWCLKCALRGVDEWLKKYLVSEPVSYFFESGHRFETEANAYLTGTFAIPEIRSQYNYVSHTFATKIPDPPENPCVRPLQAADLLAWQARKRLMDAGKRPMRRDFASLLETPHVYINIDTARLGEMASLGPEFEEMIKKHSRPVTPLQT